MYFLKWSKVIPAKICILKSHVSTDPNLNEPLGRLHLNEGDRADEEEGNLGQILWNFLRL